MAGKKTVVVLRVVAKTESFRRAGYTFTREPQDISMEAFEGKEGQQKLRLIKEEPMLFATETEVEIADATAADPAKK